MYDFFEPNDTKTLFGNVTLIKEDNHLSEQTFGIRITFGDPGQRTNVATLQEVGQVDGFDYVVSHPGNDSITLYFQPNQSEITFTFCVVPDDLVEGTEGFRATVSSQGAPFPDFQLPPSTNPSSIVPAFQDTLIRILDNADCKYFLPKLTPTSHINGGKL